MENQAVIDFHCSTNHWVDNKLILSTIKYNKRQAINVTGNHKCFTLNNSKRKFDLNISNTNQSNACKKYDLKHHHPNSLNVCGFVINFNKNISHYIRNIRQRYLIWLLDPKSINLKKRQSETYVQ